MQENILKNILAFFEKFDSQIDENTQVNNDLELIGDDADAMLIAFMEEFNVNLEGINFSEYFLPELLWKYRYYKWFKPEKLNKKPLTIGHLAEVVSRGYWFKPNYL